MIENLSLIDYFKYIIARAGGKGGGDELNDNFYLSGSIDISFSSELFKIKFHLLSPFQMCFENFQEIKYDCELIQKSHCLFPV